MEMKQNFFVALSYAHNNMSILYTLGVRERSSLDNTCVYVYAYFARRVSCMPYALYTYNI